MSFDLLRIGGNPVIALPTGPNFTRAAALERINTHTLKRRVFVEILRAATALGAHQMFMERVSDPFQGHLKLGLHELLATLSRHLDCEVHFVSIVWPWPPSDLRGRVYVHVFNDVGRPVAFCKVSIDSSQDWRIENETKMLETARGLLSNVVHIPSVLTAGVISGHRFLAQEPLPVGFRATQDSPSLLALIEGLRRARRAGVGEISDFPWWESICSASRQYPWLAEKVNSTIYERGLAVSMVHGDFAAKNVIKSNRHFYIFDWEAACPCGPMFTDIVSFYTMLHFKKLKYRRNYFFDHIVPHLRKNYGCERIDICTSLFYLRHSEWRIASDLLEYWEQEREPVRQK